MDATKTVTFTVITFAFYRPGTDDRIVKDIAEWTAPKRGHITRFLEAYGYHAPWTPDACDPVIEVRTPTSWKDGVITHRISWGVPKGKLKARLCVTVDGELVCLEDFIFIQTTR